MTDTLTMNGQDAPSAGRKAGIAQGLTIALASFLPVLAIVSLAPAVPSLMGHFKDVPNSQILVPMMVTAPGIMIAIFGPMAGWAVDKIGRRNLLLLATFVYGFFGLAPLVLNDLLPIFISRFGVGLSEAVLLTVLNTLIADYFDLKQRRLWLTVQGVIGPVLGTATITSAGFLTRKDVERRLPDLQLRLRHFPGHAGLHVRTRQAPNSHAPGRRGRNNGACDAVPVGAR